MGAMTSAEPLFVLEIEVEPPIEIGPLGAGARRVVPIKGGRARGAIEGDIVSGADWQLLHDDGLLDIDAHYAIRTASGAVIEVQSKGIRSGMPDLMQRLMAGEAVDPSAYYFRTAIRLHTGAPEYAHLNTRLYVARGAREKALVRAEVFEVL